MNLLEKTKELIQTVKIHLKNESLYDDVSYTSFWLSLLPIPGFQQINQIIDRISSNKALKIRLEDIWNEINSTNDKIASIDDEIERLQEISGTIKFNKDLKEQVENIVSEIIGDLESDDRTEWIMETENWSYQEVLNSFVEADFAVIIAKNSSTNVVENTVIKAKRTHLHAKDGSKNFIDKTKFSSSEGGIGMDGITTQGDVAVQGSSVEFGVGGGVFFGGNPNLVSGICSFCSTKVEVDRRQLSGYNFIKCPNPSCGEILNFTID